jgi:hypothetical protein
MLSDLSFSATPSAKASLPAGAVYHPVPGNPNQIVGFYIDPANGQSKVFVATKKPAANKMRQAK